MGVKVRILPSLWAQGVKDNQRIDVVGKVCAATLVSTSAFNNNHYYWVVVDENHMSYCLRLGAQIELYKEEIFTDKEYEELWV